MNVLIVEDDQGITSFLVKGLKAEGYSTTVIGDGDSAIEMVGLTGDDFDLVLLDLGLPGTDGHRVLENIRAKHPALAVIILTQEQGPRPGYGRHRLRHQAFRLRGAPGADEGRPAVP